MTHPCPWCLEPLAAVERRGTACPRCGRPLGDGNGGAVRPVDVRYDAVVGGQRRRFRRLMQVGVPVAAVVSLVAPLAHWGGLVLVSVPLLVVAHMLALRLYLVAESRPLLGRSRRFFHRWLGRLAMLWVGVPGYALTVIPVAGALAGAAVFAGLTAAMHHYTLWSLGREKDRHPLTGWEKFLLIALVLVTIAVLASLAALTLAVGFTLTKLYAWLAE
jgi:hypothetical protein